MSQIPSQIVWNGGNRNRVLTAEEVARIREVVRVAGGCSGGDIVDVCHTALHWKANHDNQVRLKQTILDRPDLQDRAKKVQDIITERDQLRLSNERMREALVQARGALRIDTMVDESGDSYGTTTAALLAIDNALQHPPESGSEVRG